ncbi:hypothetical protein JYG23_07420 [Sedimentibacter sp. zth1]|uniref:hypothetical protein n=1 Tax=Sedimentibacter sp. zth1 TaxID=2816908 RepID=UPI001A92D994|nr:hypothetical protein [Sedimentibacter sp. zth1]QSX07165.1 hypothetical protein JYG23_07420 [Sedimentibacter sp. zth1]
MIELYSEKLKLVEKLYEVTKNMLNISLDDVANKFDTQVMERRKIMDNIDELDKKINSTLIKKENCNQIKQKIKDVLKQIMDMDYQLNSRLSQKKVEVQMKIQEIDKNIEMKNYTKNNQLVKEKGFFIKYKG